MKDITPKKETPVNKGSLRYQRDKDREPVKGIFRFYEVPGGYMEFSYRKYKEDQVEKYTFRDGEIYTIPLGVAKHLNQNCWYPIHQYLMDSDGKPAQRVAHKVARCGFQSLEFVDVDDLTPAAKPLSTVETII